MFFIFILIYISRLYASWSSFSDYWHVDSDIENKTQLVNLLTKAILIKPVEFNQENCSHVIEMYTKLLTDEMTKLNFKCKLLDLLHYFCNAPAPYPVKSYMSKFVSQLPIKSAELVKGNKEKYLF